MTEAWMNAPVPTHLHLEDGTVIPHAIGTRVFNYYDMKPGVISRTATHPNAPTMPCHELDGGASWWVTVIHDDDTRALLDQSRMCSIKYAFMKGWMK